jgi:hypothetical protein
MEWFSVGKWEGDVFVVDSIGFDDRTWLDKFGYPHSENMNCRNAIAASMPTLWS